MVLSYQFIGDFCRFGKKGNLLIDGENVADGSSPGQEDKLEVTKLMYLGGTPLSLPRLECGYPLCGSFLA